MTFVVRIWDAPTRVFHWLLALCVAGLLATGSWGGVAMEWHFRLGYSTASLLLFRVIWGGVGGHWSRFSNFVYTPAIAINYIKGRARPEDEVGHNPLGALSVFALLISLVFQVSAGLMSNDEIAAAGPLVRHVSEQWVSYATFYHTQIGKLVLLALVGMHLGAIGFHFIFKHDNLVRPMLTGDKLLAFETVSAQDSGRQRWLAFCILLGCSLFIFGSVYLLEN